MIFADAVIINKTDSFAFDIAAKNISPPLKRNAY